jgi:hypothetical protein
MNPDDRTAQLLLTDYATLLANMRPDPVLRDATPSPWAAPTHEPQEL